MVDARRYRLGLVASLFVGLGAAGSVLFLQRWSGQVSDRLHHTRVDEQIWSTRQLRLDGFDARHGLDVLHTDLESLRLTMVESMQQLRKQAGVHRLMYRISDHARESDWLLDDHEARRLRVHLDVELDDARTVAVVFEAIASAAAHWPHDVPACRWFMRRSPSRYSGQCAVDVHAWLSTSPAERSTLAIPSGAAARETAQVPSRETTKTAARTDASAGDAKRRSVARIEPTTTQASESTIRTRRVRFQGVIRGTGSTQLILDGAPCRLIADWQVESACTKQLEPIGRLRWVPAESELEITLADGRERRLSVGTEIVVPW